MMIKSNSGREPKRVMIVDDHLVVRRGIISLISEDSSFTVCAEADDGYQALVIA